MGALALAGFWSAVEDVAADRADALRALTTVCAALGAAPRERRGRRVGARHRLAEEVGDVLGDRRPVGRSVAGYRSTSTATCWGVRQMNQGQVRCERSVL